MHSGDSKLLSIKEACKGYDVKNPLNRAREIGHYSVDAEECLRYDRSHMKYYYHRDTKDLRLDLNVGYEDDIPHVHDSVKVMNNLFQWIGHSRFEPLHKHSIDFVSTRGVIKYLLNTPYLKDDGSKSEHWTMCACRLDDVIYVNIVDPHNHFERQSNAPEYSKRRTAWDHKFEQYMTADHPDGIPDITSDTHQEEKFYIIVKNTIGTHNIMISAEIDAVDPSSYPGSGDTSCYVEIKTHTLLRDSRSIGLFNRHKSRNLWVQSVCTGTEKIICGLRDEKGIVRDVKVYNNSDLPGKCKNKWSPRVCLNFCQNFLDFLRKKLTVNDPRIVYRCEFTGSDTISFSKEEDPTGPFKLIPDWYEAQLKCWAAESAKC